MRPRLRRLSVAFAAIGVALAIAACASGGSASPTTSPVAITDAWARPAAAATQSAAYFTITNGSATADALVSAASPDASMVGIHETTTDGSGMTGMQPVLRCEIAAGQTIQFKPGSYHVMLMGLARDLVVGQTIELDLVFEHAGTVVVKAEVRQG